MFKTCPRCGDEFVAHVSECPDCRVPLSAAGDAAAAFVQPVHSHDPPFSFERAVVLRTGQPSDLRSLAEALAAAGIACAVDTDPRGAEISGMSTRRSSGDANLAVYVGIDDIAAASALHRGWLEQSIPGAADARDEIADGGCPGCNAPLPADATACAACGLEFPDLQVACPECGQAVAVGADSCVRCGYRP